MAGKLNQEITIGEINNSSDDLYIVTAEEIKLIADYAQKFDNLGLFKLATRMQRRIIVKDIEAKIEFNKGDLEKTRGL